MSYASSFHRLRQMAGNPELTCVKPRAEWTSVPSGYAFDASYDGFINGSGEMWEVALTAADYETVPFLPGAGNAEIALVAGGLVDQGDRFGRILPGDIATVQAAEWLEIDGLTYDLREQTAMPAGVGMWYQIRMAKR